MAMIMTAPPALEPLLLEDVKSWLCIDHAVEDRLLFGLIRAARENVERLTGRHLITQGWTVYLDDWPDDGEVALPAGPVQSVGDVTVFGTDDTPGVIDPSHYFADLVSDPARIVLRGSRWWLAPARRTNGISIDLMTGYGDTADAVPEPLRLAMLRFCAAWYENREGLASAAAGDVSQRSVLSEIAGLASGPRL